MTAQRPAAPAEPRLHYAWVVLATAALASLVVSGVRTAPGAFLLDMEADTGWSTTLLSLAAAVGLFVFGFAGPLSGSLIGRFGLRRVAAASLAVTGASMVASSAVREVWQLAFVFGLLVGLGTGLIASVLGATVGNRWFVRHRGLALGAMGASSSAGQLLFFPLLTLLATALGWREASVAIGVLALVVLVPVVLFLRDDPADLGLRPLGGDGPVAATSRPDPGIMRRAIRRKEFWLLAGTFFVCGATSNGLVGQHFIAHASEHGFTPVAASGALAVMGLFNFVGTLGSGWLTDRIDPRRLLLAYYAFRGVSLLYLPFIHDSVDITAFAVLFGLDYIATVPPTIALAADAFGRRNVGIVYGWVFASHMVGAGIAAFAAGVIHDTLGTYTVAFIVAGAMAVAAAVLALSIRRGDGTAVPTPEAAAA